MTSQLAAPESGGLDKMCVQLLRNVIEMCWLSCKITVINGSKPCRDTSIKACLEAINKKQHVKLLIFWNSCTAKSSSL